jgi:hypothetical protein
MRRAENTVRGAEDDRRRRDAEKFTQAPPPVLALWAGDGRERRPVWLGVHFPESP